MFYCLFSYHSLLELHYGGTIKKSQTAREWPRETGLLVREAEQRKDAKLFLNKYPRWELGAPHWSIILHKMFLHAAEQGQKEAEKLIHWGCQGSASEPDLGAGQSAMELVGYWTSHKEIWDIYHSVYWLRRSPGLPPCGAQQRGRVIHDILSSLTSQLHRQGYSATTGENWGYKNEWVPRLSRRESYEEALKVACQRKMETDEVLRSDIERLSWGMSDVPWTHSRSCSRCHTRSQSRSRSHSRSHGRGCSQSCPQSCSWSIWPRSASGSQSRRKVTFQKPEVELDPKGEQEDYPPEPSILDIETWLDLQACPTKYTMLVVGTQSHSRHEGPTKTHPQDLGLLNSQSKEQGLPGTGFHCALTPKCLNRNAFLPNHLSYQDVWQQPFLLTVTYARGLQYWAEKLNLPEGSEFCPLAGSVTELREMVKEYVVFTNWDLLWDLGRVDPRAMNQWPHTSSSCGIMLPLGNEPSEPDTSFIEATTQTVSQPWPMPNQLGLPSHWLEQKERTGTCWSLPPP